MTALPPQSIVPAVSAGVGAARSVRSSLPPESGALLEDVCNRLVSVAQRLDADSGASPDDRHTVSRLGTEWLQQTLQAYAAVSPEARDVAAGGAASPTAQLNGALQLVRTSLQEIARRLDAAAAQQLAVQARFLQEALGTPSEALEVAPPPVQGPATDEDPVTRICRAYSEVLLRRRDDSRQLGDWSRAGNTRAGVVVGRAGQHEAVLAFDSASETVPLGRVDLAHPQADPISAAVARLLHDRDRHPHEVEFAYGYPAIVGRHGGATVRTALLLLDVEVTQQTTGEQTLAVRDPRPRLNAAGVSALVAPEQQSALIAALAAHTPQGATGPDGLRPMLETLRQFIPQMEIAVDGVIEEVPDPLPDGLRAIDASVLLLLPRASHFLADDLDLMASHGMVGPISAPVARLLDLPQVARQLGPVPADMPLVLPLSSNPAQRAAIAQLDRQGLAVLRLDGPPGTGKSLSIANLACHLAATGRSVLVTSLREAALTVVDEMLRGLNVDGVPVTLVAGRHFDFRHRLRRDISPSERVEAAQRGRSNATAERHRTATERRAKLRTRIRDAEKAQSKWRAAVQDRRTGHAIHSEMEHFEAAMGSAAHAAELFEEAAQLRVTLRDAGRSLLAHQLAIRLEQEGDSDRRIRVELAGSVGVQETADNAEVFSRLRSDGLGLRALTRISPIWIMSPDDVARITPCEPGLFDVVIVDEASQVDLPSILPVLQRATRAVISGDLMQMQPRRFSFTADAVVDEAWRRHGCDPIDHDGVLHPTHSSLMEAAAGRSDASVMLDEHFRSLPPIIDFSNRQWYGGRLRVMTDVRNRRFGVSEHPVITLHQVAGTVKSGSQVNEAEGQAVLELLQALLADPAYAGASLALISLFEEQAEHLAELAATVSVPPERRLLVGLADQLQGDERDVILYSLSFDNAGMTHAQLSPRMSAHRHVQGMLNVLMTRARDTIHLFTSAPPSAFRFSGGEPSVLSKWLDHCAAVSASQTGTAVTLLSTPSPPPAGSFAELVGPPVAAKGLRVRSGEAICGLRVAMVVEGAPDRRVAVECLGEAPSDAGIDAMERDDILARAGWMVVHTSWRELHRDGVDGIATRIAAAVTA